MEDDETEEEIECVSCGYSSSDKSRFKLTTLSISGSERKPDMMCNVCRGSFAGNACIYPNQYRENKDIMATIAACTNMIIDEIQKGR